MSPLFDRQGNGGWMQQNRTTTLNVTEVRRMLRGARMSARPSGEPGRDASSGNGWFQAQRLSPLWIRLAHLARAQLGEAALSKPRCWHARAMKIGTRGALPADRLESLAPRRRRKLFSIDRRYLL